MAIKLMHINVVLCRVVLCCVVLCCVVSYCVVLCCTHGVPATCFSHSCGPPQEGALQRVYYKTFEPVDKRKMLSFETV